MMAAALRLFLITLCLSLAATSLASPITTPPAAAPTAPGPALISQTCKATTVHYDLCVHALSAEQPSQTADALGLAEIALRLAAKNATDTAEFITALRDKVGSAQPLLQQCLNDCLDAYMDAIEQIDDSTAALSNRGYKDITTWVTAAMGDVKGCQEGCRAVRGHKNVLTKRNGHFNKLCSISIAITKALSHSPP